jgi:hypothetical protein
VGAALAARLCFHHDEGLDSYGAKGLWNRTASASAPQHPEIGRKAMKSFEFLCITVWAARICDTATSLNTVRKLELTVR